VKKEEAEVEALFVGQSPATNGFILLALFYIISFLSALNNFFV